MCRVSACLPPPTVISSKPELPSVIGRAPAQRCHRMQRMLPASVVARTLSQAIEMPCCPCPIHAKECSLLAIQMNTPARCVQVHASATAIAGDLQLQARFRSGMARASSGRAASVARRQMARSRRRQVRQPGRSTGARGVSGAQECRRMAWGRPSRPSSRRQAAAQPFQ